MNEFPEWSDRNRIEKKYRSLIHEELGFGRNVSFVGNKSVPILRLYRFKEAFAFDFVQKFLKRFELTTEDYVFDPFCGMGTTLFASMLNKIPSLGVDKLPLAKFIAETLPHFFSVKSGELKSTFKKLKSIVPDIAPATIASDVLIMDRAFRKEDLLTLRRWKSAIDTLEDPLYHIFLLLFFSILESCSFTSKDGQFLRIEKNKRILVPEIALASKIEEAESDLIRINNIVTFENSDPHFIPSVYLGDTRDLSNISFEHPPTAIITSPPYVNRYDYSRTYCLELCFHFVRNFEELKKIRFTLLRSHIESKVNDTEKHSHPSVDEVIDILNSKPLNNPRIPYMITAYFIDMQKSMEEWAKALTPNAKVAVVVDNVRIGGEVLPVDLILSEMAEELGFEVKDVIVSRYKGNSSQQMKKYGKVPVRESIIIWELHK